MADTSKQTLQPEARHPSNNIGDSYSQDFRSYVMSLIGLGNFNQDVIREALNNPHFPSKASISRWRKQQQEIGHCRPYKRNGNITKHVLRNHDLILLAFYRSICPKATHPEVNAFLYRANFGDPNFRFYYHSQLSKAEELIGLSRKKGSTTAWQAFLPENVQKRWDYWHLPYPFGIANVRRADVIDIDECGVFLEKADRKFGKAYHGVRVNQAGPYSRGEKWNLLMAVSGEDGDENNPARRWTELWLDGGTTNEKFSRFINRICEDLPHGRSFTFTMDNLNSHKSVAVQNIIFHYGHTVVYRAPYYACDGPIEYIFNTIQSILRSNLHNIVVGDDIVRELGRAVLSMDDFSLHFKHCGFINE